MTATESGQRDTTQVPVGKTTVAGGAGAIVGLIMAIYALAQGDGSEQTWGAIVGGVVFVSSALPTLAGRMLQAYGKIRAQADELGNLPTVVVRPDPEVHSQADAADLDARDEIADVGRRVEALERAMVKLIDANDRAQTRGSSGVTQAAPPAPTEIFTQPAVIAPADLVGEPPDDGDDVGEAPTLSAELAAAVPEHEQRDIHEIDEQLGQGREG